jgi:hypothetical protein
MAPARRSASMYVVYANARSRFPGSAWTSDPMPMMGFVMGAKLYTMGAGERSPES